MNFVHLLVIVSIVSYSAIGCKKGKNNPDACNGSSTRRNIKLCIDNDANLIDTNKIVISIDSIGAIDVIEAKSETIRQDVEKHIYQITGTVDKLKKYRDGDYHIRLKDENENYIICEVPNSGCDYAESSEYLNSFSTVSVWIKEHENVLVGKEVTITGVGFIDINHHYNRKQAKNNVELHPIVDIRF